MPPRGPQRPGQVITSAVLAFVQAGVVLFASLYVWFIASFVGLAAQGDPTVSTSRVDALTTEATVVAVVQLLSVVLLVAGGIRSLTARTRTAWLLAVVAHGAQIVLTVVLGDPPDHAPGRAPRFRPAGGDGRLHDRVRRRATGRSRHGALRGRPALVRGPARSLRPGAGDWTHVRGPVPRPRRLRLLRRDPAGLVAAVVQQHDTGEVLMLAWMDDEALHRTLTTGRATYWSRSRGEYWVKGETSGNRQWVREVRLDCDGDALLVLVDQEGAACHTGARTCFYRPLPAVEGLPA